jgi:hypothetical protein
MNIDLKDANYIELVSYKIALLQVKINCDEQLARIKTKLEQVKKESKKDE